MKVPCYLGKYELFMRIGKSQAGHVYLARNTILHREVAIKVIYETSDTDKIANKKNHQQFASDNSSAVVLTHSNIVPILETTQSNEAGYIAMEYISGGNIVKYTHPKTLLPVNNVLRILINCSSALDYAFQRGKIHGNIKPENLFLASNAEIKISDFGHSIAYPVSPSLIKAGNNSAYCSPEQISGQRLTPSSDIYSLGVVAYQLLTGVLPFMAENDSELFVGVSKNVTKPPSVFRGGIPPLLDNIILRMLAKHQSDRYGSWDKLSQQLTELNNTNKHKPKYSISQVEKFNMLRIKSELSVFSDADISQFAEHCKWTRMPAGTVLANENEMVKSTFILANGSIKVTQNGRLIHIIKRGECFGEMCRSKCGTAQPAKLETLTESIIAEFTSEAIAALSVNSQNLLKQKVLDTMTIQMIPNKNPVPNITKYPDFA
jgi:serine/threonine protein kinase